MSYGIKPHGGRLINRIASGDEREKLLEKASSLQKIILGKKEAADLELIAVGAYSPLEGFMGRSDYSNVLRHRRLADGLPWTIPITLAVGRERAGELKEGRDIALCSERGTVLGLMRVEEIYAADKAREAEMVYGTTDPNHPGVRSLYNSGDILLGGKITLLNRPDHGEFKGYVLDPKETRYLFRCKGWKTVVAFQTRNPIHRAHEYIQKCALETVDGLLIHPLVGETKGDDIPAEVRMECYLALMRNYYPPDRVALTLFPAAMRYAGPREAIFHAIVRKNYGCTHFIVGRDHAGVGSYYGPYDAQRIFGEFGRDEIGITPIFFDYTFFCRRCGHMASEKTCSHNNGDRVFLSGTKVREMLRAGLMLPEEFTRPEIAKILLDAYRRQQF